MHPKVSVIMPIYNAETYLSEAIETVLAQTFKDFEFIIVDDQSTDSSRNIVQSYDDKRILPMSTPRNLGRAGADNYAMRVAKGEYVAKMDSDDISLRTRFEKQVSFLDENPDINVLGTWSQNFGASNHLNKYPVEPETAKCKLLCCLPVSNPSIMMRRELFNQGCRYDDRYRQSEDYDFFVRYINQLTISTIPETLIKYRIYPSDIKPSILKDRKASTESIQRALFKEWGLSFTDDEIDLHTHISYYDAVATEQLLDQIHSWLTKILEHNRRTPWFDQNHLERFIAEKWFDVCYNLTPKKCRTSRIYKTSDLSRNMHLSFMSKAKHIIRDVLD